METPKIKQIEELEQLASQNEELKKQLFEHDNTNGKLINHWKDATTQLQSTIEELEKAFENNKEQLMELATHARDLESTIDEKNKEIEILRQNILDGLKNESWQFKEIERLKALIESLHTDAFGIAPHKWQKYKSENNL